MKYLRKEEKKKRWPVVVAVLVGLLAIAAAVFFLRGREDAEPAPETDATIATTEATEAVETTAATEETLPPTEAVTEPEMPEAVYEVIDLIDSQIQTPYAVLHYPEAFADHLVIVKTSNAPYTLEFYALLEDMPEIRLFDIAMGEGCPGNMGMIQTPQGEVPLNVTIYALTKDKNWEEGAFITLQAMQDAVNEMIGGLALKDDSAQSEAPVISEQPAEGNTVKNIEIETPFCILYYPAKWAPTLYYEIDESREETYRVDFYGRIEEGQQQLLFTLCFGGDEGDQLGAVMNADGIPVPVYLVMADMQLEGWDEEAVEILYNMQEASNELIARLPLLD